MRNTETELNQCRMIKESLGASGIFSDSTDQPHRSWRISPEPFWIDQSTYDAIAQMGTVFHQFYQGLQRLYQRATKNQSFDWVRCYFEQGKPELVVDYGRMNRFKRQLPLLIRPDVLVTENGLVVTELDSVPGGFGSLAAMSNTYEQLGFPVVGAAERLPRELAKSFRCASERDTPVVAIVVSDESQDYWDEMKYMETALRQNGIPTYTVKPEELTYDEDGVYVTCDNKKVSVHVVYRFFELFDLKNIPKIDLLLYAARKQLITITPPLKSYHEEKLSFALLHHPRLRSFWQENLDAAALNLLLQVVPETWILDPTPVPPHAVIPGLTVDGQPLTDWMQLASASKSNRRFVTKISGFSPLSWGSRGVQVGHDLPAKAWSAALEAALENFPGNPSILQRFHKSSRHFCSYVSADGQEIRSFKGRVRLCPYFLVHNETVNLADILATVCPPDKKLIHGMADAIMAPVAVRQGVTKNG